MDLILSNAALTADYISNAEFRHASFMLGNSLIAQLEVLTCKSFELWKLPASICVRRLEAGEERIFIPDLGEFVIYNRDTTESRSQLPRSALDYKPFTLVHCLDRHNVNSSLVHGWSALGFLSVFFFGWFHALWGGLKHSLRRSNHGRFWKVIQGFIVLQNLNFYPFKSGEFFFKKRNALLAYIATHSHRSGNFQSIKHAFAAKLGLPVGYDAADLYLFNRLAEVRSYNWRGDIVKLNRWCSINECWIGTDEKPGLRFEVWGSKLILSQILSRSPPAETTEAERTGDIAPDQVASDVSAPYMERAHAWVCPYHIFVMDAFCLVSKSLHTAYSHRASQVKSPATLLELNLCRQRSGISAEVLAIAADALFDQDACPVGVE